MISISQSTFRRNCCGDDIIYIIVNLGTLMNNFIILISSPTGGPNIAITLRY